MNETAPRQRRVTLRPESQPQLARHVRLKFDEVRGLWVLLAPERVMVPDEIAVEVLQLCDGSASIATLADTLAQKYAAERDHIEKDVIELLQDLADKAFVTDQKGTKA